MMISQLWACEENALREYLETIAFSEVSEKKLEAFFTFDDMSDDKVQVEIEGDRALFSITGILTKEGLPPIAKFFGFEGTSYVEIEKALSRIAGDDTIKEVDISFDTPGGDVIGLDEVAQQIGALCQYKRVRAINVGMVASAGYWLASQATEIVSTAPSNQVGSIGVIISQIDRSSSKVVNVISKNAPLKRASVATEKGLAELQRRVDALERVFISRVVEGRGVGEEKVIADFGKGGLLISKDPNEKMMDALSVGMIDSVKGVGNVSNAAALNHDGISTVFSDSGDNAVRGENSRDDSNEIIAVETKGIRNKSEEIESKLKGGTEEQNRSAVKNIELGNAEIKENKGVKKMKLEDLLREHPEVAAELKQVKTEAYDSGYGAKQAEFEKISAYLLSDEYPKEVKALGHKVLSGELEVGSFIGAVAAFETIKGSANMKDAVKQTEEDGETHGAQPPAVSEDGLIRSDADIEMMVAETKKFVV